jgi:superfamily I DNA and/or RNA helicase
VWGCTLLSLGNNFNPDPGLIEQVVIDEAGQCHPAYAVSALLRAQSALVIGDTNQLEPVVDLSREDEKRVRRSAKLRISEAQLAPFRCFEGAGSSAQSVADRVVKERPTLIDHFRCQSEIAAVCETLCAYGLRTHTPKRSCVHLGSELNHPLLHTPTEGEQQRFSGSWRNDAEVAQTLRWLRRLLSIGLAPSDIGVITPFRGQLETLWKEMRAARIPLERGHSEEEQATLFANTDSGVALGTVHRFQGGERRIILFSTTITEQRSLRFVDERVNLVNVAASRAKEHLITVGHTKTLEAGTHTRVLLRGAREGWPG